VPPSQIREVAPRRIGISKETKEAFKEAQGEIALEQSVLEEWGISLRRKPGGKAIPEKFEIGNFAHTYAENLIPSNKLPSGLDPEVWIDLGDQGKVRLDRVDWKNRRIYEIKPDTPSQIIVGKNQVNNYVGHMNKEFPGATGSKQWEGEVVTYSRDALAEVLRRIGYII
jgi:hypothetical protein